MLKKKEGGKVGEKISSRFGRKGRLTVVVNDEYEAGGLGPTVPTDQESN